MITLKARGYTIHDYAFMRDIVSNLFVTPCTDNLCSTCPYRHACSDLMELYRYCQSQLAKLTE